MLEAKGMKIKISKYIITIIAFNMLILSKNSISETSEFNSGLTFPDSASVVFLKKVLKSMGLKFKESKNKAGTRIQWHSTSDVQKKEISDRVNQHYFIIKHCNGMKVPLPSEPSLAELSCKG